MNPFIILFKPLFTVATWIVTALVWAVMQIGGSFEGAPRNEGSPALVGFFSPATENSPSGLEIQLSDGERFRAVFKDDTIVGLQVDEDTLDALGNSPADSVSTLVRLRSDHGRTMVCRLSYNPVDQTPAGVCALNEDQIYDILFIDKDKAARHLPRT